MEIGIEGPQKMKIRSTIWSFHTILSYICEQIEVNVQ
jgi:hypothetical protein